MSISRNGNGTTQACAACKYQRRKCAPDCILSPYFPHDRQRQFLNAHKLFGISNITKLIKNLSPRDKDEAMRTIIIQSDIRANDPVGGCYRIIRDLHRQIDLCKTELDFVVHQLVLCRAQSQQLQMIDDVDGNNSTCLGIGNASLDSMYDPAIQFSYQESRQEEQEFIDVHQDYQQLQDDVNALSINQESNSSNSVSSLQLIGNCDEIKPLLDIDDVKFEAAELVERQFVPSTQLLISS